MAAHSPWRRRAVAAGALVLFLALAASVALLALSSRFDPRSAAARAYRDPTDGSSALEVNRFRLRFRRWDGDITRPTAVLLLGQPGLSGAPLERWFSFVAPRHCILAYDPRGSGYSQVRADLSFYTMTLLVEELERIRLDTAQTSRLVLFGHGFGGALALRYALAHPAQVAGLVLVSPLPPDGYRYSSPFDLLADYLHAVRVAGVPPAEPGDADAWLEQYAAGSAAAFLADRAHAALLGPTVGSYGTARALTASLASGKRDYSQDLRRLDVPTLILHGATETPFTREEFQRELQGLLPRSTLVRFERSGHYPFLEEPDRFREEVLRFLDTTFP